MNKVPNLRFKEFSDEWEKLKIEDVVDVIDGDRGENYPKESEFSDDGYCLFLNAKNVTKNGFDFKEKKFITEFKDKKLRNGKLEVNDLVLTTRGTIGNIAYYTPSIPYKHIRINSGMVVLKSKCIFHGFLYSYVKSHYFEKQVIQTCYGSAQPQLTVKGINNFKVAIPSIEEQEKIASFFTLIDKKIELQTEKVEELKNYEKGIMQKIFSQELRFKDENGNEYPEWEERKLGEIMDKGKAGGTPKSTVLEYYNGDINFLSISDMTTQGKYLTYTEKTITELGLENSSAWIVPKNSLIYSMYASVGFVSINKIELATSQAMFSMIINKKANLDYVYQYLSYFKDNGIKAFIETGTQGNLNANTVKNIILPYPCRGEQDKIAACLSSIDSKIEQEQTKLKMYDDYKKGLLQQMFI